MISSISIYFKESVPPIDYSYHFGSLFQGFLMGLIDGSYADFLHNQGMKPYSQYIGFDRDNKEWFWRVNALNSEAHEKIILPLMDDSLSEIHLTQKKVKIGIAAKKASEQVSYRDFAEKFYLGEDSRRQFPITFITPATFKTGGEHSIFFNEKNMYESLLARWELYHTGVSLKDNDVLEHLIKHTKVISYNLRSSKFDMEKVSIPSFTGTARLHVSGPLTLVKIARLLLEYGRYSGIGAKTSMGMGGIKIG